MVMESVGWLVVMFNDRSFLTKGDGGPHAAAPLEAQLTRLNEFNT